MLMQGFSCIAMSMELLKNRIEPDLIGTMWCVDLSFLYFAITFKYA